MDRFHCPWDFPGKNTGVRCQFLLQEFCLTQGLNLGLPHCRQMLSHLSHQVCLELKRKAGGLGGAVLVCQVKGTGALSERSKVARAAGGEAVNPMRFGVRRLGRRG